MGGWRCAGEKAGAADLRVCPQAQHPQECPLGDRSAVQAYAWLSEVRPIEFSGIYFLVGMQDCSLSSESMFENMCGATEGL